MIVIQSNFNYKNKKNIRHFSGILHLNNAYYNNISILYLVQTYITITFPFPGSLYSISFPTSSFITHLIE